MQPDILAAAPRCGARTRSGAPCRSPAIHGRARCRMHGGRGSGAPRGNRNAWKHGARSAAIADIRRYLRMTSMVLRQARVILRASPFPSHPRRQEFMSVSSSVAMGEGREMDAGLRGHDEL